MAQSPQTRSSTPRLSERAALLAYPDGIVSTGWPEVRRRLATMAITFDWWQVSAAKLALGKTAEGIYAASVGGVVFSIPRQVGKTFFLSALIFALALINPGMKALWTSHQLRTTKETLRAMQAFARRRTIKPFVAAVRVGNGEGEVELVNGSRILFGAREFGFGLGFSDVSLLVFDEAQRLTEKSLDDMLPTMNRAKNPLFFLVGTPPRPTDSGEVFKARRAEVLAGTAEDMVYLEFSAGQDAPRDRIDWDQVSRANPSYPDHTNQVAIRRMWKNLGKASFRREGYGIWDAETGPTATIAAKVWEARRAGEEIEPADSPPCVAVRFSSDSERVAAAACRRTADGDLHVEVLGCWPVETGTPLLERLLTRIWRNLAVIVIDGRAGAGALEADLRKAGVPKRRLIAPTVAQVHTAHAMFLGAVRNGSVTHAGQAGLTESVAVATQRKIGTAGGWGWAPIGHGDVTPLDAATYALWATATRRETSGSGWRMATG